MRGGGVGVGTGGPITRNPSLQDLDRKDIDKRGIGGGQRDGWMDR